MTRDDSSSRRDFLRSLGRFISFGLLLVGLGVPIARSGKDCINQDVCQGCPIFEGCALPQAKLVRKGSAEE